MNRERYLDLECHHLLCSDGIVEGGTARRPAPARFPKKAAPSRAGKIARWSLTIGLYILGCAAAIGATDWVLGRFV